MQTQIKFIVGGASSAIGGFSVGDTLRCSADMAAHFVEIGIAKYMEQPVQVVEEPEKRARKTKAKE